MAEPVVREFVSAVEEVRREGGPPPPTPQRKAALVAVIHNPFAGACHADIAPFTDSLAPLGFLMALRLVALLGVPVEDCGKGSIVGTDGEIERGALWHVPGGSAMREVFGGAKAIVPSAKMDGGPGTRLDVPVTHIDASYVRSHFDAMEVRVPDAPRADEIALALVMTSGARIHARAGGLRASEITGEDGLR